MKLVPNMLKAAELAENHPKHFNRQVVALWRGGCGARFDSICLLASLEDMTPEEAGRHFFLPDDGNAGLHSNSAGKPSSSPQEGRSPSESTREIQDGE